MDSVQSQAERAASESSADEEIDQWLVRSGRNEIHGPFTREQVIRQIRDGQLDVQDEVCQANGYWFYLDERDEVARQLGIEMPQKGPLEDEEITDTETKTLTQELAPSPEGTTVLAEGDLPELVDASGEGNTAVLSNRALREFQGRKAPAPRPLHLSSPPRPIVVGAVDRPSLWRWVVALLIFTVIFSVGLLIFVLQRH